MTYSLPFLSEYFIKHIYQPIAHSQCICNDVAAVSNRVLAPNYLLDRGSIALLVLQQFVSHKLTTWPRLIPWSIGHVVETARAYKQKLYQAASETLSTRPLNRKDTSIKQMTKREKLDPGAKIDPDPRSIMYRNSRFTISLLSYVHAQEEYTFRRNGDGYREPFGHVYAKYDNQENRAEQIKSKFDFITKQTGGCIVLKMDQSRFDMHLSRTIQELCEKGRLDKMNGKRPDYCTITNALYKDNETITSKNGLKVSSRKFGRKSGEATTSWGNSVASVDMLEAYMHAYTVVPQKHWTMYDDGDDMLLFIGPQYEAQLENLPQYYRELGFDLKIEAKFTSLGQVVFCQCTPVYLGGRWTMVRDPWRVMSRGTTILYNSSQQASRLNHCYSTGRCELALNWGVPVLQEYALALIRNGNGGKITSNAMIENELRKADLSRTKPLEITEDARASFALAFGIDGKTQQHMEDSLRKWTFNPCTEPYGNGCIDALWRQLA